MSSTPALVQALLQPQAYPEEVSAVEMAETHISYLFFTDQHVYKVKKPANYGFLDFTTLEKRRHFCHREVELNRRLSPSVYLGVVAVRVHEGRYTIEGQGETVEYAVKMRRLPAGRSLASLLRARQVQPEDIRRLAVKIAGFHAQAEASPRITRLGGLETVRQNVEENFSRPERYIGVCLSQEAFDELVAYSQAFMLAREGLFRRREAQGRIRDCHGDLHTAQIFLENGISIIDCIEFNQRFRYSDVAADLAFLAMDLDFHGRQDLAILLVETYVEASGDPGIRELLDFFKVYRAYVRAKVTAFRLEEPSLGAAERQAMASLAGAYFTLAHSYIRLIRQPTLVLVAGITGTGKSTVAQEVARRWDLFYLCSDEVRKELASMEPTEHRYEPFGQGIYAVEFSRRTYQAMLQRAGEELSRGRGAVLDATFRRAEDRALAVALARDAGVETWVVECRLPEGEARHRLEQRFQSGESISDGRWELYHQQQREWEPVVEVRPSRHLPLDTSGSPHEVIQRFLRSWYERVLG